MSYIHNALKPHLCKDVIGIIEDMVRWEGDADDGKNTFAFTFFRRNLQVTYDKPYEGKGLYFTTFYVHTTKVYEYSIDRILKRWIYSIQTPHGNKVTRKK